MHIEALAVRGAKRCSQSPTGGAASCYIGWQRRSVSVLSLPAPQVCQHALQLLHTLLQSSPDLARTHLDAFTPEVVRARSLSVLAQDTATLCGPRSSGVLMQPEAGGVRLVPSDPSQHTTCLAPGPYALRRVTSTAVEALS